MAKPTVEETAKANAGHVLRVLVARWIEFPPGSGERFLLDTGTLCVLSYYYEIPAVRVWNGPLPTTG